jgi:UDP-N-acetyl-D-glucosamine/UDP-N-acetyl-D-galactosamine dehydrogenase
MLTFDDLSSRTSPLAVVGLGYVGLPLAVALAEHFDVIGFDISPERIRELQEGRDRTGEVAADRLAGTRIEYSADPAVMRRAGLIIVAVPTPIDKHCNPDLTPVTSASVTVGQNLSKGSVVVFESTVYPGLTEEVCVPLMERHSGLTCGTDFTVGYSPERINPGDRVHTLETITKVVAGQDEPTLDLLARVYGAVVRAGVHRTSSIRVAEAAKVIENTQRDLNIALMNELALIFDKLGIDTLEVLEAAGTKWNFLPFRPGLVGGHCIGVDPYYLTFKAGEVGYHPQVILAGRRINDSMGKFVAEKTVKLMIRSGWNIKGSRVGVLGLTFKENCPDLRNTRVVDIVSELESYGVDVLVHDPAADPEEARKYYGIAMRPWEEMNELGALIIAVAHQEYREMKLEDFTALLAPQGCLVDVKCLIDRDEAKKAGVEVWRL